MITIILTAIGIVLQAMQLILSIKDAKKRD